MEPTTQSKSEKFTLSTPVAILISGVVIAGAIVYALGVAPGAKEKTPDTPEPTPIPAVTAADHRLGAANAKLVLVEYSDMECPFCSDLHPALKQLIADKGNEVAWVYRHFPLTQIHPQALPAALAAECVAKAKGNDAFWAFTDTVFARQKEIGLPLFESLAAVQGISKEDLAACMNDEGTLAIVQQQFTDAAAAGAKGTPYTVVLNAKGEQVGLIPGSLSYPQLRAQIEALLAKEK